jgi:MerR family transcriptional regulator, light-induced transcriptional regulator
MREPEHGRLRIGALSSRTAVTADQLRAWEKRYALLRPERSPGGFRLYSSADERRVELMKEQLAQGLSAAEAARVALVIDGTSQAAPSGGLEQLVAALAQALGRYDNGAAQAALDAMFSRFSVETVLRDALIPYLHALGESWASGEIGVDQEHHASNVIAGRMFALAQGWDRGTGPRALLACAPGELHVLGLVAFGIALRGRGWRITYLGADTPVDSLARAASALHPAIVVVSAVTASQFHPHLKALGRIAKESRLALAGAGATSKLCERVGAELFYGDPVSAAEWVEPTPAYTP